MATKSTTVENALKHAIEQLENDKAQLSREVGQLRRQVVELESSLAHERLRVRNVLDAVRAGFEQTVSRCDEAAAEPRREHHNREEDELEEEPTESFPEEPSSPVDKLPQIRPTHPPFPWWKVPCRRRMQTFGTLIFTWTTPLLWSTIFLIYVAYQRNVYVIACVIAYVSWMFLLDDESPRNGRPWWYIRRIRSMSWIWKLCAEYYPLQLVRTAELPPEKNYLFCLHPHGVFSLTHAINFATNGTGFFDLFPGIKCLLVTLRQQFKIPFHREYLLSLGAIEVSRDALLNTLSRGPGWSIAIVPGGAQEALDALNGTMRLTILKRKGFVRIALRTGASLVPVLAFGENDIYISTKGTKRMFLMRLWTKYLKKCYGLASPVAMGRGVFNTTCPDPFMIPFRKPVTTVVGRPLVLPRIAEPLTSDVDYWHAKYIEALKDLFEQTSPKYGPGMQLELF